MNSQKMMKGIFSIELEPQEEPLPVYNFEVADWHTYFVGMWMMLVHNLCYKKVFFDAFPALKGKVVVHHAIEQQVLKRYKGLFTKEEIHALENLRGIPKELNNTLHLSSIRKEWNSFYKKAKQAKIVPTKEQVQKFAKFVDEKYGNLFNPL